MNTIGMSLPFRYLTSQSPTTFESLLGPQETGLALLKKRGVDSIEIRVAVAHEDPQLVLQAAQNVWQAGLELSIHSLLPQLPVQRPFAACYPSFALLAAPLRERGRVANVTIHACHHQVTPTSELAKQTVDALETITSLCQQENQPFRYALELNRSKEFLDPSNTYDSVMAMHDQVNHPGLGVCWDFGHGYSNFTNGLIPRDPPESFLKAVAHTHIHDLSPVGKTHWPLTQRRLSLQAYVDLLKSVNYQGIWNLEIDPDRCEKHPQLGEQILQSVDLLREAVGV